MPTARIDKGPASDDEGVVQTAGNEEEPVGSQLAGPGSAPHTRNRWSITS
jgi:hypothetical protein